MADNTQKVSIKIDVSGEHIKQLKALADNVSKVTDKVKELQTAIDAMSGGTGKTTFSSSHLVSALGEVKTAIAAIKDTGFDKVSKALDSLNDQKLNNFAAAVERLKAGLDPSLIQNTSAFADAIKRMGEAQSKFSGAETARQVNDLLGGLQKMENINTANFRNISSALSELNLGANLTSIEAISRLGYALRSIKDFGEGKNPLTNLADGMRSLIGLKQSDTFLYRVRQITLAASLLARSEPVDFSKFTKALQELGRFDYESVKWENIKKINAGIKEAFEDLRTVKIPNIKGLMQGLSMVDETYKNLKPENLRHIASTLVTEFGTLSQLKMPQLGSLTKNLKLLSSGEYDFNKVAENVNTFKKSLMDLNGVKLPNIGNFFRGFEVLQNVSFRGMEAKVKSLVERINQLKTSASLDGWDNIKVPNLHSFIKGIHDLGSIRLDEQHLQNINHNIRSIPNKLREIAGIQVPDLSKFATGLLDLGRSAVNAQKVSNVIGKSLNAITENLPKHELKLPNLSGLTKGIRDFQLLQEAGKVDENSIKAIVDTIRSLTTPLKNLDKISLPNVQGIANAIHKLSTAVPENAGNTASVHISAIVDAVKKLDGVKTPDLTKISNAFKTLNESVLVGQSSLDTKQTTTKIQENIDELKRGLDKLRDLSDSSKGRIPNLKNITDAFKILNDTTLKTEEVFRHGKMGIGSESVFRLQNNMDIIKQAIKDLQNLNVNAPKMPDLKSIVTAFKDLNSPLMKLEESWKLGKGGLQSESIYRFHNNMETIKKAISDLQALGGANAPKIPSLKGVLSSFKELNETVLKGYSSLSEGGPKNVQYIYENINAIKAIYTALQSVSTKEAPKIPSLKGVMAAFRELNDTSLKGKGTDDYGNQYSNILTNLNHLVTVITTLQSLGKKADSALPSLSSLTTFFKTFNEKVRKEGFFDGKGQWTGESTTRLQRNAEHLRDALLKISEAGKIQVPNLSSITTAFKVFNESVLKGAFTDNYGNQHSNMLSNIAAVKHIITELQSLGGKGANKIPNLNGVVAAFNTFNNDVLKTEVAYGLGKSGLQSESIYRFHNNLNIIKKAISDLQALGAEGTPKIPDLKGIVTAFKDLNSPLMKLEESWKLGKGGLQSESIYRFHNNMNAIKEAISSLQALGGANAPKIPSLKGVMAAFKELNETVLRGYSSLSEGGPKNVQHIYENIAAIKHLFTQLQSVGGKEAPKLPSLKGVMAAFRELNDTTLKGAFTDDFGNQYNNVLNNLRIITHVITELQTLGKKADGAMPSLSSITTFFKTFNEKVRKEGFFDGSGNWTGQVTTRVQQNAEYLKDALLKLAEVGKVNIPNLSSVTTAFKVFNESTLKGAFTDNYGNQYSNMLDNLAAIKHVIKELQALGGKDANKIPSLSNITAAFRTFNDTALKGTFTDDFGNQHSNLLNNLATIKHIITELQSLGGKDVNRIPNLSNITTAFKTFNDTVLKGTFTDDFGNQHSNLLNNLAAVKHIITELQSLGGKDAPKIPNLSNITTAFKTFNEDILKGYSEIDKSGKSKTVYNFTTNLRKIKDAIKDLQKLNEVTDGVKPPNIPNLKNVTDAFKVLNDTFLKGSTVDDFGNVINPNWLNNLDIIKRIITELQALGGKEASKIPNLSNTVKAFKTFNEDILKGYSEIDNKGKAKTVYNFDENIKKIKEAIKGLQKLNEVNNGVKPPSIPNLKNVTDAFKVLNDTFIKGSTVDDFGNVINPNWLNNLATIKYIITELQAISGKDMPKIPNLKNVSDAFRVLNESVLLGSSTWTKNKKSGKFVSNIQNNIDELKKNIAKLQALGAKDVPRIPNLKGIAEAFKILNENVLLGSSTWTKEKGTGEFISNITRNIDAVTEAITKLQTLGGKEANKIPNLKNITDAFKTFNNEFLNVIRGGGMDDYGNAINRVTRIKENIKALYDVLTDPQFKWDSIKLPNVKNLADAFKTLNSEVLERVNIQGEGRVTRVAQNLRALKNAFATADFSTIKVPNLKNVSDAFKTLNSIEKLETVQNVRETPSRIDYYVDKIAQAFLRANDTLKEVKLPNIKNVSDAFKTLNSIEYKEDKQSNFVKNLEKVWEQLRKFKEDPTLQDIKFPNIKNVAEAFRILDTTLNSSERFTTGNFNSNFAAIKDAINQLRDFDKVKLPNVKNIADAFKILNESEFKGTFYSTKDREWFTNFEYNVKAIKEALLSLKETGTIKLPNLKNLADAFAILNKIPQGAKESETGANFRANMAVIIETLTNYSEQLSKIKLPNLKNIADGFSGLTKDRLLGQGKLNFIDNVNQVKWAIEQLVSVSQTAQGKQISLPNLDGLAKGFKTLNELNLNKSQSTFKFGEGSNAGINKIRENVNAIIDALKLFEGKNFDIPNIKNLGDGLKRLNDIATVNQQLPQNMETLKRGLEVINGFRAPQLKNFADGLHSLESFSQKSKGELINDNLAKDLSNLATALSKFTGITLPSNLAGFAKGVEAINKVNIEHFSKKFLDLIRTMHTLNLNVPQTAIDALTAKLVVCEHAIRTVEGRLNNATSVFARFGDSVQGTDAPLTKFQERVKTFLQYRVISNVFNRITNWIQSIPENIKEFEKAMYNVQSITGATDTTIAKLGVTVKEIASTTKFSAQEVADGMTMIAQAGFSAGQSMQMMQSISDLATGTLTDMRTVVDLVTSAMVVFGIESNNSARVSDVFANAVNKSKLTMDKIRTAFNYIGPVARDANISFEESAVAMMLLANSGQKASTIGTGLRNVLSTILSPSKKLAEAAATVGVSLTDLDPRVNSFRDVLSNLGIVVRDSQVALDVFGKRGATAVLSLTNGIKDYDRLYSSVTRVGSAAEMAAKQQEGLYVRWKNLSDRAQLLAVTLGENGLTAIFSGFVDVLSGTINFINSLDESSLGRFTIRLVALVTAIGSLTVAFKALWATWAIGKVMFSPLVTAISYFNTLFPSFTKSMGALKQNFRDVGTAATASSGAIKVLNDNFGSATLRVTKFGLVLRTIGSLLTNLVIATAPLLAIIAFDYFTVTTEKLERNLQKISEQLDKINNQSKSITDTLDKITKLQAGTEEYANAIKSILTAIEDNKGAVIGAETEFTALLASVNETNDAFTDGGAALRIYGQRLKELSVIQASSALQTASDLFNRNMRSYGFFGGPLKTKAKIDYGLAKERTDEVGTSTAWRDMDYSTANKIFRDIATGVKKIEDVFGSKKGYTAALDAFNELNERAAAFVNSLIAVGDISVYSSIDQVRQLADRLGVTGDQLDAVIAKFGMLHEAAKLKLFADVMPMDVRDAVNALRRETGSTKVAMEAKGNYNFDSYLFFDENNNTLTERVKEQVQAVDVDVKALQNDLQAVANELEKVSKNAAGVKFSVNAEDVQKATAVYAKIIQLSLSIEKIREEHAKKLEEASKITDAVEREETVARLNREYKQLEDTLRAINNENLKERNEERNVNAIVRGFKIYQEQIQRTQRMQENLNNTVAKYKELTEKKIADARADFQKNGSAVIGNDIVHNKEELEAAAEKHSQIMQDTIAKMTADTKSTIASIQQSSQETLLGVIRAATPVGTRMEEIAKEERDNKKRRDTVLQSELNRIQIQEDAYKQSEGRIGLAFKEARAKEQEAHVRYMAARLADILRYEKEIKDSYRADNEETKKALEKIQEMKKAVVEEGYRAQHDLDRKNAKAAFFLAKEQGDAIANQEKRVNEQRKQRQEKALHEVAALESKGIISHEEAELKKAEISVKYHDEIIKARKEQIEVLKQLDEAQNIQQIIRLEEEIEKSTYDAVKAARQGIEAQTKAVYEAEKKLKELQGESFKFNPLGDFNANQQAAITAEYEKEVEKRKKLIAEGFDLENDTIFSSTSKVAEEIRKHYDKVDSIAVKSAEKRETLEQNMLKKKEEYEKKKLDITKKYDAKILALEDERQDAMDTLDAKGNSKKLQKKKTQRAEERIKRASGSIASAVEKGDTQELEALSSQLQSATSTLLGAEKPSKYRGDIQRAFDLRKQILEAQKKLELKEEEEKFQRELKQDKRRLEVLKSSAEQALLAENGRHELAMSHLEQEAEKIREQIRLAKELMSVYNEQISKGEVLKAQERTVPAGQKDTGLPTQARGTLQEATNRAMQGDDSVKKSAHDVLKDYGLDKEQYDAMLKELEAVFKGTQKAGEQSAANVTNAYKDTIEELKKELTSFSQDMEDKLKQLGSKDGAASAIASALQTTLSDAVRILKNNLDAIEVDVEVAPKRVEEIGKEVTELVASFDKLKADVTVQADTTRATAGLTQIIHKIKEIPNKIRVDVVVQETNVATESPAQQKASGGLIFSKYPRLQSRFINKGSGTKDDVPALLMKNEFVHRAAAVKKYGVDFMYKLNNLQIPASITKMFANGGIVGSTVGFIQKYANGGLIRSTKRKLEELFAGSDINLNVNNLDVSTKLEQAANEFTSPIGMQAIGMMAKNIEAGISHFVTGGTPQNAALNAQQAQAIADEYSKSIARAQATGNTTIARALRDERNQITVLSEELQQNLAELHRQYTEEVSHLNSEHNKKIQEKKAEYDKNVREENAEYDEKVYADEKKYTKEDEEYEASKKERKESYDTSIKEIKDNLEEERLSYEADLLSKQQTLTEKEAALQDFRNQLHSDKYPVGFAGHENASIEELITAHAEYAKQKYGSDKRYIIDLGGLVKTADILSESAGDKVQSYATRLEKMTASERSAIETLVSTYMKGLDSPYSRPDVTYRAEKESDYYNRAINEYLDSVKKSHGRAAYLDTIERFAGGSQELPPEQSIPYVNYLFQHLYSDYTIPLEQAKNEYLKAKDEDNPDTKATKEIKRLTEEFNTANQKAEEERKEVLIERKKAIDERETSHKERLAELKQDYDNFVQQENAEYDKSTSELKEANQESIAQTNIQHSDRLKLLKNNTAQVVSSAKEAMAASINAARKSKAEAIATASVPQTQSTRELDKLSLSSLEEIIKRMRSAFKFATGGLVPFTKGAKANTDSVLSLLSPNEFVMSAKAVRTFGVNFMQSLNNLRIPAFATGGMVGASTPVRESAIDKIMNKTVYALDLTLNNTHIGELTGEKDTIDSFMFAMDRARMGMV